MKTVTVEMTEDQAIAVAMVLNSLDTSRLTDKTQLDLYHACHGGFGRFDFKQFELWRAENEPHIEVARLCKR